MLLIKNSRTYPLEQGRVGTKLSCVSVFNRDRYSSNRLVRASPVIIGDGNLDKRLGLVGWFVLTQSKTGSISESLSGQRWSERFRSPFVFPLVTGHRLSIHRSGVLTRDSSFTASQTNNRRPRLCFIIWWGIWVNHACALRGSRQP